MKSADYADRRGLYWPCGEVVPPAVFWLCTNPISCFLVGMDSNCASTRGSSPPLHHHLTQQIIGAFYDVYHELNCGFVEGVYQGALAIRLKELGARAEVEVGLEVPFHEVRVGWFRADLVVEDAVLVELKALPTLNRDHDKQLLNYLRVSNLQVGLLLNFGPTPQVRRLVSTIKKCRGN